MPAQPNPRSVFDWFHEHDLAGDKPWLVLGKGPSFALKESYDLDRFHLLSLNHAVREIPVLLAHVIDYDVVAQLGEALVRNARYLVMPWVPHEDNRPSARTLGDLATTDPTLRRFADEGRLLWYNLSDTPRDGLRKGSPIVRVRYFSVEAALHMLAVAGVRTVRSLGIDGGKTYSTTFEDLKDKSLLTNRRESFDVQFREIARTILETGIDYAPLNVTSPIRVYVGTQPEQTLARRVLEYSVRKNTSMSVDVIPLCDAGVPIPVPKDPANRPRTPFTFQRFLIPAHAGGGRAIYLDSDMQVFADLRALWTLPFDGADVLAASAPEGGARRPQFSVMVLDCDRLDWRIESIVEDLDRGRLDYERLMYEMAIAERVSPAIPAEWNSLERYEPGVTRLLHYTDMDRQPWLTTENPLGYLWSGALIEAVEAGHIALDDVREEVRRGHVRPSLLYQVENRIVDGDSPRLLHEARRSDSRWTPPAGNSVRRTPPLWRVPRRIAAAAVRSGEAAAREMVRAVRARVRGA